MKTIPITYTYKNTDVKTEVLLSEGTATFDAVLFLGIFQDGELARAVLRLCRLGVAIAQCVPHWLFDEPSVAPHGLTYYNKVLEVLFTHEARAERVRIYGESMACFGVVMCDIDRYMANATAITLIQPLGFNGEVFQKSYDPMALFRKRSTQNIMRQLTKILIDSPLRQNLSTIRKKAGFSNEIRVQQYVAGLTSNTTSRIKELIKIGFSVDLITGERDALFSPSEITESLKRNDLVLPTLVVSRVPHCPLSSQYGRKLLEAAELLGVEQKRR